jgi:hypothetical protein
MRRHAVPTSIDPSSTRKSYRQRLDDSQLRSTIAISVAFEVRLEQSDFSGNPTDRAWHRLSRRIAVVHDGLRSARTGSSRQSAVRMANRAMAPNGLEPVQWIP